MTCKTIGPNKRYQIYQRDGFRCVYCGATEHLTIDHITPRCDGGNNKGRNLATACSDCNCRKGKMSAAQFMAKLAAERNRAV